MFQRKEYLLEGKEEKEEYVDLRYRDQINSWHEKRSREGKELKRTAWQTLTEKIPNLEETIKTRLELIYKEGFNIDNPTETFATAERLLRAKDSFRSDYKEGDIFLEDTKGHFINFEGTELILVLDAIEDEALSVIWTSEDLIATTFSLYFLETEELEKIFDQLKEDFKNRRLKKHMVTNILGRRKIATNDTERRDIINRAWERARIHSFKKNI